MFDNKRIALGAFGAVAVVAAAAAVPAFANNPGKSARSSAHVTICHATPADTAAHGYVRISPSAKGVYSGHLRQHAADIIPPFVYKGVTYSENWDATGQATWSNNCVAVGSSTTTTGTTDTTTTTTTGTTDTTTTTGTTTGAVAGSTGTKSGVKGVTHPAHAAQAKTAGASFAG